jgi:hypothetical protein
MTGKKQVGARDIQRELRPVFHAAVAQRWTVWATGGGHHCWISPVTGTPCIHQQHPERPARRQESHR